MPTDVRDDESLRNELNRSVQNHEAKKENDDKSESYSELLSKLD